MTYKLAIDQKPTYLHAIVTGENSKETVMQYMEEVVRECITRDYGNVLIEERLEGPRLATMEIFSMVSEGAKRFIGKLRAIAFVDVNGQDDSMRFAEDIAVNRGIPVQVFSSVADAEKWLLHQSPNSKRPA